MNEDKQVSTEPIRYFQIPEDTIYLILGILRLEKDGVDNPQSNIETALDELTTACAIIRGPVTQQATAAETISPTINEIVSMSENLLVHLEDNDITYHRIKETVKWIKGRAESLRQGASP